MGLTDLIDDYLLVWVLGAVATGLLAPGIAVVTEFSTAILAVMIGSVSLTLSVERFAGIDRRALGAALVGHVTMAAVAYAVATLLELSPPLVVGFVIVGAVTPELVSPTMTELAGGETALSTAVLVLTGLASLGYVPGVVTLAAGASVDVAASVIVVQLLVAVVAPMALAVGARTRFPGPVSRYDAVYPSISAVMVVLIISGVTAANAGVIRSAGAALLPVGLGAVTLNGVGYLLGWIGGARRARPERIAVTLSVGTRDFAVAAALVVAAGLPTIASLPAVTFGVVEMATSAGLARYFARDR
jgi:BASS family bile acid:Na+ symporter